MEKSINNYEESLTNKSKELYHQLVQEKIIPAIQNEDDQLHLEDLTEITNSLETEVNNLTDKINKKLMNTEETGKIYKQRKIDVEQAFGNLKANLAFTRFSVRGKDKVVNELGFALMAINIRKLTAYRQLKDTNELKNKDLRIIFLF